MFRRMMSRPRHLTYTRNNSYLNQLPFMNNYLPFTNDGGMYQQNNPIPFNPPLGGGNPLPFMNPAPSYQGMQGFPFQGMPFQNMPLPPAMNNFNGAGMVPNMQHGGGRPPLQGLPFMNPYPTQNQQQVKQQSSQVQSFMNQFKGQDGNVDMKKMMDTAGQMMNTVNQLNNMVKGIAATFKA